MTHDTADDEGANNQLSGETPIEEIIDNIPGVGRVARVKLQKAGFETANDLKTATTEELQEIQTIGPSTADEILEHVESLSLRDDNHTSERSTAIQAENEGPALERLSKEIDLVGRTTRSKLSSAGYDTWEALYQADNHELQKVRGIGPQTAERISRLVNRWLTDAAHEVAENSNEQEEDRVEASAEETASPEDNREGRSENTEGILEEIHREFEIND